MAKAASKNGSKQATPLDVRQAVSIALDYFRDLSDGQKLSDISMEEVELSDEDRFWRVTVGFFVPESTNPLAHLGGLQRQFKIVTVNAQTGDIRSIKLPEP